MQEQTDELAGDIYSIFRSETVSRAMASMLIDKGWRKQSEGEWIAQGLANPKCSVCKHYGYYKDNFCPNCGAKMKGD
jgi:uncharacterized OB-fold protein